MINFVDNDILEEYDAVANDAIHSVDIISYDDCIAIMDQAIYDSLEGDSDDS